MDYEKKYNEALERARKVYRNYKNLFPEDSYSEDIEEIFPELRESEDEKTSIYCVEPTENGKPIEIPKERKDFKKLYEDALGWMREVYPNLEGAAKEDAEHIFPELCESEDEMIRKELVEKISNLACGCFISQEQKQKFIAYLEKQKEQKPNIEICPRTKSKSFIEPYMKGWNDAMASVKSVEWSEEDEKMMEDICSHLMAYPDTRARWQTFLKRLRPQKKEDMPPGFYLITPDGKKYYSKEFRIGDMKMRLVENEKKEDLPKWKPSEEQKPTEWSEEDKDMLNSCISSIEEAKENRYAYKETDGDTSYDHEIAWLKSLRPSWKPSDQ